MEISNYTQKCFINWNDEGFLDYVDTFKTLINKQLEKWDKAIKRINNQLLSEGGTLFTIVSKLNYDYDNDTILLNLKIQAVNEDDNILTDYNFKIRSTSYDYIKYFLIEKTLKDIITIINNHKGKAEKEDFEMIKQQVIDYTLDITTDQFF